MKKVFLQILQNSQTCKFIKKETLAQVFSKFVNFFVNFVKFLRTPFFIEHFLWLRLKVLRKTVNTQLVFSFLKIKKVAESF